MLTNTVRKRLVMGNWKMNGSLATNASLLASLRASSHNTDTCDVVVCVPFPYLAQVAESLRDSSVMFGAQDLSHNQQGAYTGDVSADMLADLGCSWVLVGHSERRSHHAETDQLVAHKASAALAVGLTPVVCIGETLAEQEAGHTLGVVARQLAPVLALGESAVSAMVIAYEPVWAIGTGRTATPQQAQDVHAAIRTSLDSVGAGHVRILYGGSVNASNAAQLFSMSDIDGALVGGASLIAEEFSRIVAA